MNSVTDHYAQLLAPIYVWMAGGAAASLDQGAADLETLKVPPSNGQHAVDLGAGFGMHAIPLARLGYEVTAIDTSVVLLSELRKLGEGLNIRLLQADLLDFAERIDFAPALILCMGDTLTHLSSTSDVDQLMGDIARSLAPGGRFLATFRNYSHPLQGDARFIAVRSDSDRIHTCFLEEEPDRMRVHDIVHERNGAGWSMRVSHYPKLRLRPDAVKQSLEQHGLVVTASPGPRGMVQIVASRPAS